MATMFHRPKDHSVAIAEQAATRELVRPDQIQATPEAWLRSEAKRIYWISADPKLRGLALIVYGHSRSFARCAP